VLGVTRQAVDSWERGISLPSFPQLITICDVFGWPNPLEYRYVSDLAEELADSVVSVEAEIYDSLPGTSRVEPELPPTVGRDEPLQVGTVRSSSSGVAVAVRRASRRARSSGRYGRKNLGVRFVRSASGSPPASTTLRSCGSRLSTSLRSVSPSTSVGVGRRCSAQNDRLRA